ncbi:MAG: FliA/WhiG family RNA polymerase sigma factor [Dethiobacter sp.]|nr:FliA/WhiG family RNA polymerase sigma factor [Dethiobacter sp.]
MSGANVLWQKYQETKDEGSWAELVSRYLPLVRLQAGRLALGLPPQVSREDLLQSGVLGLLEALQRFNPAQGVKFETYASLRIRGAMLDELRRLCWLPRALVKQMRELGKAQMALAGSLGREPTEAELAREMGVKPEDLRRIVAEINSSALLSLEETLFNNPAAEAPETAVLEEMAAAELATVIDKLPERQRVVLALYYQEEMTLKEIGLVLGVSESRVCQLHAHALAQLRAMLAEGY